MIHVPGARPDATAVRRPTFSGEAWLVPTLPGVDGTTIATVTFTPCARTFWHSHEHGQVLQVVAGSGYVCTRGETPVRLVVGDTVWVPPGEQHWHGAGADTVLVHTAISLGSTTWLEEVTEAEYRTTPVEEKR